MKELREQIAKIIKGSRGNQWRTMQVPNEISDQILSLPIAEGLWVEKKCVPCKNGVITHNPNPDIFSNKCPKCYGTGIIRRPATLQDYLDLFDIVKSEGISCEGRLLPDGSKLVWEDK